MTYLWLKAGHVIFVIFWMAGLFMLPRFYVYHQEAEQGSEEETRWLDREAKLRKIILTPSLVIVWALGLALAFTGDWWSQPWLHAKIALVLALSGYHGWLIAYGKKLADPEGERASGKTLRLLNEVPGLAAALIVVLVIVKPF